MEVFEILEKGMDEQRAEDLPMMINKSLVRKALKDGSGKRISAEVIDAINLVVNTIVEDVAGCAAKMPGKTIAFQDIQMILELRQNININVGSFHVKKVSQRASKKMVQYLVRQAIKEVKEAEETGEIKSLLDKYDILDDNELDEDD